MEGNTLSQNQFSQIHDLLSDNTVADEWDRVVIAYEALWTMEDKVAATPDQAQHTHAQLRGWLREHVSEDVANKVRIVHAGE